MKLQYFFFLVFKKKKTTKIVMYIYNIFLEVWYSMSLTDLFNVNNSLNHY